MPVFVASRSAPVVYLNVPKSGCTSVKNWLYYLDYNVWLLEPSHIHGLDKRALAHYDVDREEMTRLLKGRFVFTFVRHPIRRAYSTFCEKFISRRDVYFENAREMLQNMHAADITSEMSLEDVRSGFRSFLRFVQATSDGTADFPLDWHWAPQTVVLENAMEIRLLDFIGRLEAEDDIKFVEQKAARPFATIPRLNRGPRVPFSYDEIITDDLFELGRIVYDADFRNFGYS